MTQILKPHASKAYAALRIVAGLTFLCHGTQKLFGWPIPAGFSPPPMILYIASPIEFIGGLLIAIGLYTRWAAFLSSGLMAAAYWIGHGMNAFFPIVNQGELAILYCFLFLFICAHGPGIWSVDGSRRS